MTIICSLDDPGVWCGGLAWVDEHDQPPIVEEGCWIKIFTHKPILLTSATLLNMSEKKKPEDHRVKKEDLVPHTNYNEANNAAIEAVKDYIKNDNELGKKKHEDLRTLITSHIQDWFGGLPTRNVKERVIQIDAAIEKMDHLGRLRVGITLDVDVPKTDDAYQIPHVGWDVLVNGNKSDRAEHTLKGKRADNLKSQDKSGHCFFVATGGEVGRPLPNERKKLPSVEDSTGVSENGAITFTVSSKVRPN